LKTAYFFIILLLAESVQVAAAQPSGELTYIGMGLFQRANSPDALARYNRELLLAPEAFLVPVAQPGTLELVGTRRVRVPAMRYNVAMDLLETTDSTGTHVWPPGSLLGFTIGQGAGARRFSTALVRNGGTKRDFVEVLTAPGSGPLLLAFQHNYVHVEAEIHPILRMETRKARTEIGQTVVAGLSGASPEPLRPLALNRKSVLRLFGTRAAEVDLYALKEQLDYADLNHVLRLFEYYNQLSTKQRPAAR
jgi:hypothetical protein